MKKSIKILSLLTSSSLIALSAVSCGREVSTIPKLEQDKRLSNKDSIKTFAENTWLGNTIASLYQVNLEQAQNYEDVLKALINNQSFANDALRAYNTFLGLQNQKEPGFLAKKINKLLSEGILNYDAVLENLTTNPNFDLLNAEQFKLLYVNKNTDVALETNKALLVYKYFLINNEADLTKIDSSSFNSNKAKYDLDYFNLVQYALSKKLVQAWGYSASDADAVFVEMFQTIENIDAYNDFLQSKVVGTKKIYSSEWINKTKQYQLNLAGYVGIKSASDFAISFDYELLKQVTNANVYTGFYDNQSHKIVEVNDDLTLAQPISVANGNSKIEINYINVIVPIAKDKQLVTGKNQDGSDKKETVKVLTFENTPYQNNLIELATLLSGYDSNLYQNALNAYVKLGYVLTKGSNELVNKAISDLTFVEK
ncbi:HinT-interacting membrane complex lipoprotein P60 [Mycoplasmopsis gallopavonis]|uniref:P60-like lipoprotein n=1 Tax=Mycoplasmopsis gallopavonis TaxID=76629 RepID=A0A449AZP6_9BACT|nr:hypothetical protein [Mycoplasmopsis gallopavonis]RIV16273.1 hypothetical protein D1113_02995 [Mycoplasmopsis gallopavonis]VEU72954.1 Uncharacterised protein [Mycoplasmopsis gallopavonis]